MLVVPEYNSFSIDTQYTEMIDKEITLPSRHADTTKSNQHQAPHASITTTMSSNYLWEVTITVHQS